jgi:membrane protein implicated in regulation of membrane protease activity
MEMRLAIFFAIPAVIFIALALWLDNGILMWIGVGCIVVAGAIFAFDQLK